MGRRGGTGNVQVGETSTGGSAGVSLDVYLKGIDTNCPAWPRLPLGQPDQGTAVGDRTPQPQPLSSHRMLRCRILDDAISVAATLFGLMSLPSLAARVRTPISTKT